MDDTDNNVNNDIGYDTNADIKTDKEANSGISNNALNKKRKRSFNPKNIIIALVIVIVFLFGSLSSIGVISIMNKISPTDIFSIGAQIEDQQESAIATVSDSEAGINNDVRGVAASNAEVDSGTLTLEAFDNAVSELAQDIMPSIVNIKVKVMQSDFFGNQVEQEGVGSGVIFSSDGYIITNNHVAGDSTELIVTLSDGTEYPARLVGADENTDIAVIKIEAQNLTSAEFTSIENIKAGEIAIALGSPFGLQKSVTMGVISALGRDISISADTLPMVDLIQTDATINPGNSGGPLVNSKGQVIGINTIIYSTSGSSSGVGFAIPSDTAANIAQQIIKYGKARLPVMGIEMGDNNTDIKGVFINSVTSGYPAEKAGIKSGDIVTEIAGKQVETQYQLLAQILRKNVGDIVSVKIYRQGTYLTFNIELAERPTTTTQ